MKVCSPSVTYPGTYHTQPLILQDASFLIWDLYICSITLSPSHACKYSEWIWCSATLGSVPNLRLASNQTLKEIAFPPGRCKKKRDKGYINRRQPGLHNVRLQWLGVNEAWWLFYSSPPYFIFTDQLV